MKDFNNTEEYPVPEGLEFQESYMRDAFALYDAEKQKRKRRLLIWWLTSSAGFAAVLLAGIYFFTKAPSDAGKKLQFTENKITITTPSDSKTSSVKDVVNENEIRSAKTADVKTAFVTGKKTVKSNIKSTSGSALNNITPDHTNKTTGTLTKRSDNRQNSTNETTPTDSAADHLSSGLTTETHNSLAEGNFTALPLISAQAAFASDTAPHSIQAPNHPFTTSPDIRKHQVYINLGVNTLFGMKELQNRVTFRESIGVSYNYQIRPKLAIGAGLEYHSISRISYKRKVGDTTNSDNTTTILNKTTLNYISFLPQLSYQLAAKHRLTAGLGVEYLLVNPGERYEIENFTSENNTRSNSKLYYSTFNRFNFSASIGYSFQFSPFMSAHALYHFGFTDITKNNDFNSTFDRNSRLQLMLKIKLY